MLFCCLKESSAKPFEEDFENYRLSTVGDGKVCSKCNGTAESVFRFADRQAGVNFPPLHPMCRCTFEIVVDDWNKWLDDYEKKHSDSGKQLMNRLNSIKNENRIYTVGKIDKKIYSCITNNIMTNEVIITENQINHIKERHPNDYEKFSKYFNEIVSNPDYIIEANRAYTALILKEIKSENQMFKTIVRLVTPYDNTDYKNSIITFMKINDKEWNRLLKNKKILYKRE